MKLYDANYAALMVQYQFFTFRTTSNCWQYWYCLVKYLVYFDHVLCKFANHEHNSWRIAIPLLFLTSLARSHPHPMAFYAKEFDYSFHYMIAIIYFHYCFVNCHGFIHLINLSPLFTRQSHFDWIVWLFTDIALLYHSSLHHSDFDSGTCYALNCHYMVIGYLFD